MAVSGGRRCASYILRRRLVATSAETGTPPSVLSRKLNKWLRLSEDFLGLTEVKQAQDKVIKAEADFLEIQAARRTKQQDLTIIRTRLKAIEVELDKTKRGDDRYLELLTEEHSVAKSEQAVDAELESLERNERDRFALLSTALRESHEKERTRSERTRYWSLAGSLVGAFVGVVGATLSHRARTQELREAVRLAASVSRQDEGSVGSNLQHVADRLGSAVLLAEEEAGRLLSDIAEREQCILREVAALRSLLTSSEAGTRGPSAEQLPDRALDWTAETSTSVADAIARSEKKVLGALHAYGIVLLAGTAAAAAIAAYRLF